jgi:hypothetical protein
MGRITPAKKFAPGQIGPAEIWNNEDWFARSFAALLAEARTEKPRRQGRSGGAGLRHGPLKLMHRLTAAITPC